MARGLFPLIAGVAYLVFFATFLYLIAFVGDLPWVALTVDRGPQSATELAVVVDVALIALFGLQHSVMARPGFKAWWTRTVPAPIERSVYVIFASLALILLYLLWRPIPEVLWRVENSAAAAVLWGLSAAGWLIVLLSTFLINHFELFGLSQVYRHARRRAAEDPQFRQPLFYKMVRHPLYSGFLLAFWATPVMSYGHLLFAAGMTAYVLIAIRYEERDLVGLFGTRYEQYRGEVGMLTPRLGKRSSAVSRREA